MPSPGKDVRAPVGGCALVLDDDTAVAASPVSGRSDGCRLRRQSGRRLESVLVTAYDLLVVDIVLGESQSGNQLVGSCASRSVMRWRRRSSSFPGLTTRRASMPCVPVPASICPSR